jgi:transcriptional regulator with PAS, ATPase and Fis domain
MNDLIMASPQMRAIEEEVRRTALSDAKILLTGESGVGKEVIARLIHRCSARRARPYLAINCAGVPESLLESELFGHVRGSFTGAHRDRAGLLEQADGGTMLMDEVGEMSLRMQGMLLRFLEDGQVCRVGSERPTTTNVRLVAATNRVLPDQIAAGTFREDLYYRLNVIQIVIPPLRMRREDIEPLLRHFLEMFAAQYGVAAPALAPEVLTALNLYNWPGNVRELKNLIERAVVRGQGRRMEMSDLPDLLPAALSPAATIQTPSRTSELYHRMVQHHESFWGAVYAPFVAHDLTRADLRVVVAAGLEHTRGNYTALLDLFNMVPGDYKRFLSFLHKHECHLPMQQFRGHVARPVAGAPADRSRHDGAVVNPAVHGTPGVPALPIGGRHPAGSSRPGAARSASA